MYVHKARTAEAEKQLLLDTVNMQQRNISRILLKVAFSVDPFHAHCYVSKHISPAVNQHTIEEAVFSVVLS
jgi:hypothetical protein